MADPRPGLAATDGAGVIVPDFDALYGANADPWQVETSWYERRKLSVLLSSLPYERYRHAWEPGCGVGVATRALAARAEHVTASDSSVAAVELARRRCADLAHVEVVHSDVAAGIGGELADLVVAAEFLYYLPDLGSALEALWGGLGEAGHLVVLHWRHRPSDAYVSGETLHHRVAADAASRDARALVSHTDVDFRLDIYQRR